MIEEIRSVFQKSRSQNPGKKQMYDMVSKDLKIMDLTFVPRGGMRFESLNLHSECHILSNL